MPRLGIFAQARSAIRQIAIVILAVIPERRRAWKTNAPSNRSLKRDSGQPRQTNLEHKYLSPYRESAAWSFSSRPPLRFFHECLKPFEVKLREIILNSLPQIRKLGICKDFISSATVILVTLCFGEKLFGQHQSRGAAITADELFNNWKTVESWDQSERTFRSERRTILDRTYPPMIQTTKTKPNWDLLVVGFNGTDSVFARSPRYFFQLWHEANQDGWLLRNMDMDPSSPEVTKFLRYSKIFDASRPLSTLYTDDGEMPSPQIYSYSQTNDFKLLSITPEGELTDAVKFEYKNTSGVLYTDRNRSSLVMRSVIRGKSGDGNDEWIVEMERSLFAETSKNGIPRCKKIEWVTKDAKDGEIFEHQTLDFSEYNDNPIKEKEFYLSSYGMPEPIGTDVSKSTRWYMWLILAGVVSGAMAFVFRHLRGRNHL